MYNHHFAFVVSNFLATRIASLIGTSDTSITLAMNSGINDFLKSGEYFYYANVAFEYWYMFGFICLIAMMYKVLNFKKFTFWRRSSMSNVEIDCPEKMADVAFYLRHKNIPGILLYLPTRGRMIFQDDIDIPYVDENTNCRITSCTKKQTLPGDSEDKPRTIDIPYIRIYVENSSRFKNAIDYYDFIMKEIDRIHDSDAEMKLHFFKGTPDSHNTFFCEAYYDGPKLTLEERKRRYIDSFFHKNKDWIWSYCNSVHNTPDIFRNAGQVPYGNFLLHGPPGTGKSTLVYRLAMTLGRHIVSVDLSNLGKFRAYWSIRRPDFAYSSHDPSECIILLEEVDIAIKKIYENTKRKKIMNRLVELTPESTKCIDPTKCMEEKNAEKCVGCKKSVERDAILNSGLLTPDTNGGGKNDPKNSEMVIEDLLELLQGPVPSDGSLIFATTNHYEEIKEMCPAIFRPGRLTPVFFDNLDSSSFDEMCMFYFGKTVKTPTTISVTTSSLVGMAMTVKTRFPNDNDAALDAFVKLFESNNGISL